MKRTIPTVVSCLSFCGLFCLLPFFLTGIIAQVVPTNNSPNDTLFFSIKNCTDEVTICIDSLPLAAAIRFSVLVNDAPYQPTLLGCNFDTISAYTYTTLFGQGDLGPYELTAWSVGNTIFSGIFNSIPGLVDSMNLWDPRGNWELDERAKLIIGGAGGNSYSDMNVVVTTINSPSFIGYNFGMEAKGTALHFGAGIHNLSILDENNTPFIKKVIVVACTQKKEIEQAILIGETRTKCLDFSHLLTPPKTVTYRPISSSEKVAYQLNETDSCISFTGLQLGIDTTYIIACDTFNFCDTTLLYTTVYPTPLTATIEWTMELGESKEVCVETNELPGDVTAIKSFCENNLTETIFSNINNVDLCFNVTAQNIGKDTICLVTCDNFLISDTTFYIVSVTSSTLSLTATPDLDTTSINSPLVINILGNDEIPDGIITNLDIYSLDGEPTNGTATTNPDGTLNYIPNPDFCGDSEAVSYIICNDASCDTTEVTIYVKCATPPSTTMQFYTGFSPNGDDKNDYFFIDGITQYPNNELVVFNRWGTTVYEMKGYKNAWDGTWNKKQLPDGTYFYLLKDGTGNTYRGSIYIRR